MPFQFLNRYASYLPQRWITCALCSWAIAIVVSKKRCYREILGVVSSIRANRTLPIGGCALFYHGCIWESKRQLPFPLPDVYWNPMIQDLVNGAFTIGIVCSSIPAGLLSDLGYTRRILGGGMFLVVTYRLMLPTVIGLGSTAYLLGSFVEGIGEGALYPSIVCLITWWSPHSKRNTFTSFAVSGIYLGEALGHFIHQYFFRAMSSWNIGTYITGVVGLVWLVLWFVFGYHSPADSPFVSPTEYLYITRNRHQRKSSMRKLRGIPWRKIFTSRPFLSLVLVFCALDSAIYVLIGKTVLRYQRNILHLPERVIQDSSVALVASLPTSLMGGVLTDWLLQHRVISKTFIKRLLTVISIFGSCTLCLATPIVGCKWALFVVMLVTVVFLLGLVDSAIYSNPTDLSPGNAGILMGIMSGARTVFSILSHKADSVVVDDFNSLTYWLIKLWFGSLLAFAMTTPYIIYGSGQNQHWGARTPRLSELRVFQTEEPLSS